MKINAEAVRALREQKSWSQEHLASASGLSARTVQRVEMEGAGSAETRLALAAALGVPVADLFCEAGAQSTGLTGVRRRVPLWGWIGVGLVLSGVIAVVLMSAFNSRIEYSTFLSQGAVAEEPIVEAVRRGDRERAEYLLLNGSSADAVSSAGESLLRIAIGQSDESMVELLLEAGADANARDANGDGPLHVAARENLISIFELLLEAGADTDARNAAGETPSQVTAADELHELLGEARAR